MTPTRSQPTDSQTALTRFLERVRHSASHDLRTPLGTIVNYAAVLEAKEGADAAEVRDLGRRIRGNAQRAARMVQLLAGAIALATRPLHADSTDLLVLARSILGDAGGRGDVRVSVESAPALARVDAEVLGYAWRAYVAVESDASGKAVDGAEVIITPGSNHLDVDFYCGTSTELPASNSRTTSRVELAEFLRHNGGSSRLESSLGLGLAQELLVRHGGDLEMFGRPGMRSGMRVRLPIAA